MRPNDDCEIFGSYRTSTSTVPTIDGTGRWTRDERVQRQTTEGELVLVRRTDSICDPHPKLFLAVPTCDRTIQ